MSLPTLANELLFLIAHLLDIPSLNSLLQTTTHFTTLFTPRLYDLATLHDTTYHTPHPKDVSAALWASHTVLYWASKTGHLAVVARLIKSGDNVAMETTTPFAVAVACEYGNLPVVQLLIGTFGEWDSCDTYGVSIPLRNVVRNSYWMVVASGQRPEPIMGLLVGRGVDAVVVGGGGGTLLHDMGMCQERWMGACGMIVAGGRAVGGVDERWCEAQRARLNVVGMLMREGVDINARDAEGRTALWCCVGNSEQAVDMVVMLLGMGADVEIGDVNGRTVLHRAAGYYHMVELVYIPVIIQILLDNGANAATRDSAGQTALDIAEDCRGCWKRSDTYQEVLRLLRPIK